MIICRMQCVVRVAQMPSLDLGPSVTILANILEQIILSLTISISWVKDIRFYNNVMSLVSKPIMLLFKRHRNIKQKLQLKGDSSFPQLSNVILHQFKTITIISPNTRLQMTNCVNQQGTRHPHPCTHGLILLWLNTKTDASLIRLNIHGKFQRTISTWRITHLQCAFLSASEPKDISQWIYQLPC